MTEFIARLKQRKLVQWAIAYVAFAFALIQVLDVIAQRFAWPDQLEKLLIIALAIGFVVVLVLAWYHGERGAQKVSGTEIVILALLLAIGGGLLWRYERVTPNPNANVASSSPDAAQRNPGATPSAIPVAAIPAKSIAVLPFENLSSDKDNAYFSDGMQDLILTKLADIGDLKVISRTSTEKYASHPDNLKVIAQQLGVAAILEGSVQKAGNQVLINVQLIDAASDNHLWANAYPRTLDNIFGVEGEVAQKVADALQAQLSPAEVASVAKIPTRNAAAYDLFLKAEYQLNQADESWDEATFLAADADHRRAIALDPDFALAYARLAYCQLSRHWFAKRLTEAEMMDVKTSIDRALALAPDLADAHLALAYYDYWGFHRYDDAIAEFQRVLQLQPSNTEAIAGLGYVFRRNGHWPQALTYLRKAVLVSPRDGHLRSEYGATFLNLRRYPEADQQLRLALDLDPAWADARDQLLYTRLFGFGDAVGARQAFQPPPGWRISSPNQFAGDVMSLINLRVYPDVFERHFDAALHDWDAAPTNTPEARLTGQVARVAIKLIAGQRQAAQPECEKLAPPLRTALKQQPDSLRLLQQWSWVAACLGRNADAVAAAHRAVALLPIGKDSYFGANQLVGLAQIDAQTGAPDEALRLIRQLLAMPAGAVMSIEGLKLDPVWDPLRKDPRFQALLKNASAAPAAAASGALP